MAAETKDKETKLGGNIALVGFEILEPAELTVVKKIVGNYVRKMGNCGDYQEMRLTLQQHPHGKTFKHEIKGLAVFKEESKEGRYHSDATEWNLYNALAQVCDKIIQEVVHSKRKEEKHKLKKNEKTEKEKLSKWAKGERK